MTENSRRLVVGPFNRVEGDLEVTLDVADGAVAQARVTAPLYRGFEQILLGHPAEDALVIAPRICGICSVSQSTAAARALAGVAGVEPPANGRLAADLVLAAENAADHLTHFVLFFMPDFARKAYAGQTWFEDTHARFAADGGTAARVLVPARARFLHVMGLLAGKWPHSLALQPGGTTKGVDNGERVRLLAILAEFREVLEAELYGTPLERIAALDSLAALDAYAHEAEAGDFRRFLRLSRALGLDQLGRGPGRFLASDGFFKGGVWEAGTISAFDPAQVIEDTASAWLRGAPAHPSAGVTHPDADKPGAYSWCKAPRLDGRVVEVGALARQLLDGQPLAQAMVAATGGTVRDRVAARLVELARLVLLMEGRVRAIRPGEPFCADSPALSEGAGVGLTEAARGTLGHWLAVSGGQIASYQIVAPTTWNFSPRDAQGTPGALEQALAGTPVTPGETTPVAVQHVVRSFDPCMVCTVH